MTTLTVRRAEGERGTFIVLWAILIVALLTMVAIVIDLGDARNVRRTDQSVADFSALAAGDNLDSAPATACADAFAYVKGNLSDFPTTGVTSPCNVLGSSGTAFPTSCGGTTAAQDFVATGTSPYSITFRYPVADGDITDTRFSGAGVNDGSPCERFKVTVARTRRSFFAGVVNEFVRTTQASAVMRTSTTPGQVIPSLWLLDPTGCVALDASGGSQVTVGQSTPTIIPGAISIDSDGLGSSCSNTKWTMDASGSGTQVHALPSTGSDPSTTGQITLFSMSPGSTSCTQSQCDQGDVSSGRVAPQPQHGERATRAPADWAWNCKTGYPTYHSIVPIPDCPYAPGGKLAPTIPQAYIDTLVFDTKNTSTAPTQGTWQQWTTASGHSNSCNPKGAQVVTSGTNVWIDCPGGFSLGTGDSLTVQGGNVVFDGPVTLNGSSLLSINTGNATPNLPSACKGTTDPNKPGQWSTAPFLDLTCAGSSSANAAYMYMRNGDLGLGGGTINLNNTALYQANGSVKTNAGSPATWHAPTEGPFNKLAMWSEKSDVFTLNGGGSLDLQGTFFAPEADTFKLTGGGGSSLLFAQFIAYRLSISGGGTLNLVPSAAANLSKGVVKGALIR